MNESKGVLATQGPFEGLFFSHKVMLTLPG